MAHSLTAHQVRAVAVAATVDPRSVLRELTEPGSVRGDAGRRIREAIARLGSAPDALAISSIPRVIA